MATPSTFLHGSSGNNVIDSLLSGARWFLDGNRVLTWGTGDNSSYFWVNPSAARDVLQPVFDSWEAVANIDFQYVGHTTSFNFASSDLTLTFTDSALIGSASAIGIFPSATFGNSFLASLGTSRFFYPQPEGDIGFNIDKDALFSFSNPGSAAFYIALHEVGHALGLKHTHDGGLAGFPTLAANGLAEFDSAYYSVMSYNTTSNVLPIGHSATPMPLDILAIQTLYGANTTTGLGDTTYFLSDDSIVRTIYDVGGTDSLVASFSAKPVSIDLQEASFSVVGTRTAVATAFGTVIENAEGSQSSDSIIGNAAQNRLIGHAGNDTIFGQDGSDFITGGTGDDVLYGNKNTDLILGGAGNDALYGGQNDGSPSGAPLALRDGVDTVSGGLGDDLIYGNHGADLLLGDEGADTIFGGQDNDTLSGGAGDDLLLGNLDSDIFSFANTNQGADQILSFDVLTDSLVLTGGATVATSTLVGANTVLTLNSGTTITLIGVEDFDPTSIAIA